MSTKSTRLEIRTTQSAKYALEQASQALGISVSAFMLDSSMSRAREINVQSELINLSRIESQQFIQALENPPQPNKKLRKLFQKYTTKK